MSVKNSDIDLNNQEFANAWNLVRYTNQSVFLTGKAGTGKSTFLKYITANTDKKFVVLAPTGIAAVNVGGQTLHSFFRLPFKPFMPDDPEFSYPRLRDRMKYTSEFQNLLKALDLIIIDEISMVRADTIDFIDRILRFYTRNRRVPFGGKQLLLVGDVFQLEPVVTGDTRNILSQSYPNAFFFSAQVFRDFDLVPIELRKVYRQTDSGFVNMLDRIRDGHPLRSDIETLNSRCCSDALPGLDDSRPDGLVMTIATRRDTVDSINETRLAALPAKEYVYKGEVSGDFPESSYPTDLQLRLKVGSQVVFIKNDQDHRWVNGTLAKVSKTLADKIEVELADGTVHTIVRERWANVSYHLDPDSGKVVEQEKGVFMQYPVKLAWALTIHKSQGLTFDRVIIDIGRGAFAGGQSYVALSRCRSLDGITMRTTINERDVWVNPDVTRFSRSFNDQLLIQTSLESARADGAYAEALQAVGRHDLLQAADAFTEAASLKNEPLQRPAVRRLIRRKLNYVTRLEQQIEQLDAEILRQRKILFGLATEQVELAEECRENGELDAAMANYNRAIELAPDYHYGWMGRGLTKVALGDVEGAMADLRHATVLNTTDYHAPMHAAELARSIGDIPAAMDLLLVAHKRNPDIPAIHDSLAEIYLAIGEADLADIHHARARKLRRRRR